MSWQPGTDRHHTAWSCGCEREIGTAALRTGGIAGFESLPSQSGTPDTGPSCVVLRDADPLRERAVARAVPDSGLHGKPEFQHRPPHRTTTAGPPARTKEQGMKFDSIRAGGTYYTVSRQKMGNTTMSTVAVHSVRVISCDSVKETIVARWNGNPERTYYPHEYSKWRKTEPLRVKCGFGHRLATREEIKAHKEAEATKDAS